jgi:hypothetical protein
MTRRRTRPPAPPPTGVRLGPYTLSAVVVVTALVAAFTGGAGGLEVFLVGAALCLISAGVWRQRAGLVLGGAVALAASTLLTAATTPILWESARLVPVTVLVVDAGTGSPIGDATLAVVGQGDEDVPDRGRTDTVGNATLIVPIKTKLHGTLYEMVRRPRVEFADLGWEVEAAAEGYESAIQPIAGCLPAVMPSVDPGFFHLTIALKRAR